MIHQQNTQPGGVACQARYQFDKGQKHSTKIRTFHQPQLSSRGPTLEKLRCLEYFKMSMKQFSSQ